VSAVRVTIENGTTRTFRSAAAAVEALLRELGNEELQNLKLAGIHREQLRRMDWVKPVPPKKVGANAVKDKPLATEIE